MGMANLRAGLTAGDDMATGVGGLFRTRYPEMVRLANLLGADDPEDIAQEAFARLIRKYDSLRNPDAALAYVRASVCNLTRNRHRHLRVTRRKTTPASSSPTPTGMSSARSRSARSTPPRHSRAAAASWCSTTRLTCWSQPRAR
jgi:DNA-directed RNA polymerase specialized sigma24 family protein